jgi:hypothetical protein
MGFKERLAAANAKAAAARAEKGTFKENMAAANEGLKEGLAVTKENWDGKRADLAAERSEIREGLAASREQMAAANADLKEGLAETKAKWDEDRAGLADERADMKVKRAEAKEAARAERDASILARSSAYARSSANADLKSGSVRARKPDKGESFEGVTLKAGQVTYKGQGGPVAGATARVESAADVHRRITATRFLLAGGVFSRRKQVGHVFLTVEAPGFELLVEVPVKKEAEARGFAAKINNAAKRGA